MPNVKSFNVNSIDSSINPQASDTILTTIDDMYSTNVQDGIKELYNNIDSYISTVYNVIHNKHVEFHHGSINYLTGTEMYSEERETSDFIPVAFIMKLIGVSNNIIGIYDNNKKYITYINNFNGVMTAEDIINYAPDCKYIKLTKKTYYNTVSVIFSGLYLNSHIQEYSNYTKGYIDSSVNINDVVNLTLIEHNELNNMIIPCKNYKNALISGIGGNAARLYALLDSDNKLIENSSANLWETLLDIEIGSASKLIINSHNTIPVLLVYDSSTYYKFIYENNIS